MLRIITQSAPKLEDQAIVYSHRTVGNLFEDEIEQDAWNTRIGQAPAGLPIELSKWSRNAVTTQDITFSLVKTFMLDDPATEFSTLERNEDQVTSLIGKIRTTQSIPDRESIARRLFELLQDIKEEEPDSSGMPIESLRNFYSFLQTHSNLKKPAIGLTPVNEIYVSWKAELGSVFSIHFLSSGLARFAIIAYNPRTEQQSGISGLTNIESLVEKVKPWGVLAWAGREGR